jgi:AcrR family transcriptional regulator
MSTEQNKTRTPQQERAREKKKSIIEAGFKLFSEKGFYKTNSKELAEQAGVSIGTFYAYFKDKKDLFLEVVNLHFEQVFDKLFTLLDTVEFIPEDKEGFVRSFIEPVLKAHDIFPDLHEEIGSIMHTDPDVEHAHRVWENKSFKSTAQILKRFGPLTKIKDADTAAVLIVTTIDQTVHMVKHSHKSYPDINPEKLIDELVHMLTRYIFWEQ